MYKQGLNYASGLFDQSFEDEWGGSHICTYWFDDWRQVGIHLSDLLYSLRLAQCPAYIKHVTFMW